MRRALGLAVLLLAGCTGPPKLEDCGLVVYAPPRSIDEGTRWDVQEVVGGSIGIDVVGYRFTKQGSEPSEVVFEGRLLDLAADRDNRTLRFLDARNDSLLNQGDAFVARWPERLSLLLTRGTNILGGSFGCS